MSTTPLYGYMVEFDNVDDLLAGAEVVRDAGYTRWDAHSPFVVHGLDKAMGIKPTILPVLVFLGGLAGCTFGLVLQWWTNAVNYPFIISGKPLFSLPANIPIIFEMTILFAAITAFIGQFGLNGLPRHSHPLFANPRFHKATDDGFFITIETADPIFDQVKTWDLLSGLNGRLSLEEVSS